MAINKYIKIPLCIISVWVICVFGAAAIFPSFENIDEARGCGKAEFSVPQNCVIGGDPTIWCHTC
jgi:hypothetical protein